METPWLCQQATRRMQCWKDCRGHAGASGTDTEPAGLPPNSSAAADRRMGKLA